MFFEEMIFLEIAWNPSYGGDMLNLKDKIPQNCNLHASIASPVADAN